MSIYKIFKATFIVDILVFLFVVYFYDYIFILNIQLAYLATLFIIYATYKSYQKNILAKTPLCDNLDNQSSEDDEDFKKTLVSQSFVSYISFYRILGYIVLIAIVLSLINNNIFNAVAFMIGVSIVPVGVVFYLAYNYFYQKD